MKYMLLHHATAVRYVTPLREGGSVPAIVETDSGEQYVVKFRGAGQGPKALVAELLGLALPKRWRSPYPRRPSSTWTAGSAVVNPTPRSRTCYGPARGPTSGWPTYPAALRTMPPLTNTS